MTELYRQIGAKIRELRLSYPGGLSQEALGEKLQIGSNTVSRWETATYKPSAEDLDKLARFFSVSITVFFPDLPKEDPAVAMLASATAGLDKTDLEEVLRYAEFRRARRALQGAKRVRPKS
jgi:transcriptional regulator with XRE-family HTH domain